MYGMDQLLGAVEGFLSKLLQLSELDLGNETSLVQSFFLQFFTSWGNSFGPYGVFIPARLVTSVGLSLLGAYLVFMFMAPLEVVGGDV